MSNDVLKGELDRVVHEPARLRIMTMLSGVETSDFNFLLTALGLTKGNLSSHIDRLEKAGYVDVEKGYQGKIPHTGYRLTDSGLTALNRYWESVDTIRAMSGSQHLTTKISKTG